MPNIAEFKTIFKYTPSNQAIMLVSKHGMGKSEFVRDHFKEQGYKIITLFLGQMSDAGDLIGLPDRTVVEFSYKGESTKQKITEFCPPKWWPHSDDIKLVLILEEFNRGIDEVYQCLFDMVLNGQLNGLLLPKDTRIIGCMNPLGDDYDYNVKELDPAMEDRFNFYEFKPTFQEWIDWALANHVNKFVIGYLSKHNSTDFDPPNKRIIGQIYPSRRSWKRVSDIITKNPDILEGDMIDLKVILQGIIGPIITTRFVSYIKDNKKGLYPGRVVTAFDNDVLSIIKGMSSQEIKAFLDELAIHLEENEQQYFNDDIVNGKEKARFGVNLEKFFKAISKELVCYFYRYVTTSGGQGKTWAINMMSSNEKGLTDWFIDCMYNRKKEDNSGENFDD